MRVAYIKGLAALTVGLTDTTFTFTHRRPPTTGRPPPTALRRPPASGRPPPAVHRRPPTTGLPTPAAHRRPPTAGRPLPPAAHDNILQQDLSAAWNVSPLLLSCHPWLSADR